MPNGLKVFFGVGVLVIMTLFLVHGHLQKRLITESDQAQIEWVEQHGVGVTEALEVQLQAFRQLLSQSFIDELTARRAQGITSSESRVAVSSFLLESGLDSLSHLEVGSDGQYRIQWISHRSSSDALSRVQIQQILQDLPITQLKIGQLHLTVEQFESSPQKIAVLMKANYLDGDRSAQSLLLGLLPLQYFHRWSQSFQKGQSALVVFNDRAQALAFPQSSYVGTELNEEFLIKKALEVDLNQESFELLDFEGRDGLGAYRRVAHSNLYVGVIQPLLSAAVAAPSLPLSLGTWFLIFACASLCGFGVFALRWMESRAEITSSSEATPVSSPNGLMQSFSSEREDLVETKEQIFKQIAEGVVSSLKGPLAAILGHVQLARAKSTDSSLQEHHRAIETEARQARGVVDSLQRVTGHEPLELESLDVVEVLLAAIQLEHSSLQKVGVQLKRHLSAQHHIMGHRQMLTEAFRAVIKNSIEALEMIDDRERVIEIREHLHGDKIVLSVEDNGPGIPAQMISQVHMPFFSQSDQSDQRGLGLGMALGVVRSHSGRLEIQSEEGQWTRVSFELPLTAQRTSVTDIPMGRQEEELGGLVPSAAPDKPLTVEAATGVTEEDQKREFMVQIRRPKVQGFKSRERH